MAEVVGPGLNQEAGGGPDAVFTGGELVNWILRDAVAWHDTVVSGRFDDIPNRQNGVLNALSALMHQWPDAYRRFLEESRKAKSD